MYNDFLEFMVPLARATGDIHMEYFRTANLGIVAKSNIYDVVTMVDKKSEDYIVNQVLARYPDHKILGEEGGYQGAEQSDYLWVVDPLDGTTNFSQGLPLFSVSIALKYKDVTIAGVVYAPYLDELFMASLGSGARMVCRDGVEKVIHVGDKQRLDTSVLATGFPYDKDVNPDNNSDNVARIVPHLRDLRRFGSAAYDICATACGILDGYWELGLHEWDVCAANLILSESGGVIDNFRQGRGVSQICGNKHIVGLIGGYVK